MPSVPRKKSAIQKQKDINTRRFVRILQNNLYLTSEQIMALFLLIKEGINLNTQHDTNPLYACVNHNNFELSKKLIEEGANVNIECDCFFSIHTPLHRAAAIGNERIIRLLINAGANIDAQDNHGKTPLHYASLYNKNENIILLLLLGAKADIKDNEGNTLLHTAVINGSFEVVRFLIENKVDVDAKDNIGNTPLHYAVGRNTEIAELLLNAGANTRVKNNAEQSPLKVAFAIEFVRDMRAYELTRFKRSLLLYINKFAEAGWQRFEILCDELGEAYASVDTACKIATKILAEPEGRIGEIIDIIERLYFNAAKMAPPSLISRLFAVLEDTPAQECASSSSSSSSQSCPGDEQPPAMMITRTRKRNKSDSDSEQEEGEQNIKRSRKGHSL